MKKEVEMLIQYTQADFFRRMHMFLQFPDLRHAFQEIDRKDLAAQIGSRPSLEQHNKKKCFSNLSLQIGAYCGIAEIRILKNFLKFLKGLKPKRGIP